MHNSEYTKNYWIVHFKKVNVLVYYLYLNKAVIQKFKGAILG